MKSRYKNLSEIRNVAFIFKNFKIAKFHKEISVPKNQ